jgi:hypothetical protein
VDSDHWRTTAAVPTLRDPAPLDQWDGHGRRDESRGRAAARSCVGRGAMAATRLRVDSIHLFDWRVAASQGDAPSAMSTRDRWAAPRPGATANPEPTGRPAGGGCDSLPAAHWPRAQHQSRVFPAVSLTAGLGGPRLVRAQRLLENTCGGPAGERSYSPSVTRLESSSLFRGRTIPQTHAGNAPPRCDGDSAAHRSPSW